MPNCFTNGVFHFTIVMAYPYVFLNHSKDYVDLAFWHFEKMDQYTNYFVDTNRKSVRSLRYKSVDDIHGEVVVYVIQKQLEINLNPFKLIRSNKSVND